MRDSAALGTGRSRLVLLAPRLPGAEHAASSLVGYLPCPRLVYAGDLLVPRRFEPNYWRQSWDELRRIAASRGLEPVSVASLHDDPVPWDDVLEALGPDAAATASR
ncbi:MAG TPA: hypothetical protein VKA44_09445 [Gemmatimonadota bacterium]|nr:hypothetical protein [Gemmatimonadota bacterium]